MTSRRLLLALCAAALVVNATAALAADQTVNATVSGIDNSGIKVQIRTSDIGATPHYCTTGGSGGGCTVTDQQSSIPKNIGNMLCLPQSLGGYTITAGCNSLLSADSGSCQGNSATSNCGQSTSSYSYVAPKCNYRTSSSAGTSANWNWTITSSGGSLTIDCSQSGYTGYTQ